MVCQLNFVRGFSSFYYRIGTLWSYRACWGHGHGQIYNPFPKDYRTPSFDRPASAVLAVNRQIHVEASRIMRLLDLVPHRIEISDQAFRVKEGEPMLWAAKHNIDWTWELVFPGDDLSIIKELRITIRPSDYPGFWACLSAATETLCDDHLLPRKLPKGLKIELQDMVISWGGMDQACPMHRGMSKPVSRTTSQR